MPDFFTGFPRQDEPLPPGYDLNQAGPQDDPWRVEREAPKAESESTYRRVSLEQLNRDYLGNIARRLLGSPIEHESDDQTLRFGKDRGSLAVEIDGDKCGTWYDHHTADGGGAIKLLTHCGVSPTDISGWLRANLGVEIEGWVEAGKPKWTWVADYMIPVIITKPRPVPLIAIERGPPPGSRPPPIMYRWGGVDRHSALIETLPTEIAAWRAARDALRAPWPNTDDVDLDDLADPGEGWQPRQLSQAAQALAALPRWACRRPISDDDWCGASCRIGESYCTTHQQKAYTGWTAGIIGKF